jgi:hypothetical protein
VTQKDFAKGYYSEIETETERAREMESGTGRDSHLETGLAKKRGTMMETAKD